MMWWLEDDAESWLADATRNGQLQLQFEGELLFHLQNDSELIRAGKFDVDNAQVEGIVKVLQKLSNRCRGRLAQALGRFWSLVLTCGEPYLIRDSGGWLLLQLEKSTSNCESYLLLLQSLFEDHFRVLLPMANGLVDFCMKICQNPRKATQLTVQLAMECLIELTKESVVYMGDCSGTLVRDILVPMISKGSNISQAVRLFRNILQRSTVIKTINPISLMTLRKRLERLLASGDCNARLVADLLVLILVQTKGSNSAVLESVYRLGVLLQESKASFGTALALLESLFSLLDPMSVMDLLISGTHLSSRSWIPASGVLAEALSNVQFTRDQWDYLVNSAIDSKRYQLVLIMVYWERMSCELKGSWTDLLSALTRHAVDDEVVDLLVGFVDRRMVGEDGSLRHRLALMTFAQLKGLVLEGTSSLLEAMVLAKLLAVLVDRRRYDSHGSLLFYSAELADQVCVWASFAPEDFIVPLGIVLGSDSLRKECCDLLVQTVEKQSSIDLLVLRYLEGALVDLDVFDQEEVASRLLFFWRECMIHAVRDHLTDLEMYAIYRLCAVTLLYFGQVDVALCSESAGKDDGSFQTLISLVLSHVHRLVVHIPNQVCLLEDSQSFASDPLLQIQMMRTIEQLFTFCMNSASEKEVAYYTQQLSLSGRQEEFSGRVLPILSLLLSTVSMNSSSAGHVNGAVFQLLSGRHQMKAVECLKLLIQKDLLDGSKDELALALRNLLDEWIVKQPLDCRGYLIALAHVLIESDLLTLYESLADRMSTVDDALMSGLLVLIEAGNFDQRILALVWRLWNRNIFMDPDLMASALHAIVSQHGAELYFSNGDSKDTIDCDGCSGDAQLFGNFKTVQMIEDMMAQLMIVGCLKIVPVLSEWLVLTKRLAIRHMDSMIRFLRGIWNMKGHSVDEQTISSSLFYWKWMCQFFGNSVSVDLDLLCSLLRLCDRYPECLLVLEQTKCALELADASLIRDLVHFFNTVGSGDADNGRACNWDDSPDAGDGREQQLIATGIGVASEANNFQSDAPLFVFCRHLTEVCSTLLTVDGGSALDLIEATLMDLLRLSMTVFVDDQQRRGIGSNSFCTSSLKLQVVEMIEAMIMVVDRRLLVQYQSQILAVFSAAIEQGDVELVTCAALCAVIRAVSVKRPMDGEFAINYGYSRKRTQSFINRAMHLLTADSVRVFLTRDTALLVGLQLTSAFCQVLLSTTTASPVDFDHDMVKMAIPCLLQSLVDLHCADFKRSLVLFVKPLPIILTAWHQVFGGHDLMGMEQSVMQLCMHLPQEQWELMVVALGLFDSILACDESLQAESVTDQSIGSKEALSLSLQFKDMVAYCVQNRWTQKSHHGLQVLRSLHQWNLGERFFKEMASAVLASIIYDQGCVQTLHIMTMQMDDVTLKEFCPLVYQASVMVVLKKSSYQIDEMATALASVLGRCVEIDACDAMDVIGAICKKDRILGMALVTHVLVGIEEEFQDVGTINDLASLWIYLFSDWQGSIDQFVTDQWILLVMRSMHAISRSVSIAVIDVIVKSQTEYGRAVHFLPSRMARIIRSLQG